MTDWFTDEIFGGMENCADVIFPISRLVVDPERFENDDDEPMSAQGMGVVYELTSSQQRLRIKPSAADRRALMNAFYHPHHLLLSTLTDKAIEAHGHCLILDGHSFPSSPLPYEMDQSLDRPDICIGSDDFHTPGFLLNAAVDLFEEAGFDVAVNRPFSGALVPLGHFQSDKRVSALMIEVRRDLYMNESTAEKHSGFDATRRRIRLVLSELIHKANQG